LEQFIPLLIVGVGLGVYVNSFAGAFVFDDKPSIVNNLSLRSLWPPWTLLNASTRPVINLTLAANHAMHGLLNFAKLNNPSGIRYSAFVPTAKCVWWAGSSTRSYAEDDCGVKRGSLRPARLASAD
jgi:hypothetical protein